MLYLIVNNILLFFYWLLKHKYKNNLEPTYTCGVIPNLNNTINKMGNDSTTPMRLNVKWLNGNYIGLGRTVTVLNKLMMKNDKDYAGAILINKQ